MPSEVAYFDRIELVLQSILLTAPVYSASVPVLFVDPDLEANLATRSAYENLCTRTLLTVRIT